MKAQSSNVKAQSSKFELNPTLPPNPLTSPFGKGGDEGVRGGARRGWFCHLDFTWLKTFVIWILIFFLFILLGCGSLPRIIILNDPLSAEEHLALGISYETKGMLDQAITEYKAALSKEGSYSRAMINLGNVYYKKGDYEKAEGYYIDVLKIDKDNPYANNNLAWIFILRGVRLAEAERLVLMAVEKDPKNRAYYLETLALVYYKTGRLSEALRIIDEAESLSDGADEQLKKALAEDREKILAAIRLSNEDRRVLKGEGINNMNNDDRK